MKRYALPVLLAGLALTGAGTALAAFGPGGIPDEALAQFTSKERAAIEKANAIRAAAEEEARQVLADAGITEEEMRDAMKAFHEERLRGAPGGGRGNRRARRAVPGRIVRRVKKTRDVNVAGFEERVVRRAIARGGRAAGMRRERPRARA